MGARERNIALAREGMAAFNRDDIEAVLAILDPAIECYVSPRLMNAGTWHGHEGWGEMVSGWGEAFDRLSFEGVGIDAVDDRHVVMDVHQTGVGRESGVPVELDVVFLFEVVDGLARRFQVHPDRESALAAIQ